MAYIGKPAARPARLFQQRHFEALAELMQRVQPKASTKAQTRAEYREQILRAMCKLFAAENPKFSEDRFRCACVPGANVRSNRHVGPAMPYVADRVSP
jgi:hypothetical protein